MATPSWTEQRAFWDGWNQQHRTKELGLHPFMARQAEVAAEWVQKVARPRILEVGCGTGWLAGSLASYGEVFGTDLSPQSIAEAQSNYPQASFVAGDFAEVQLPGRFDYVVSADVIAHVPDQQAFVDKIAAHMEPGGLFVLMTQNPFVWYRSSYLKPQGQGQIRNWPPLGVIKKMMRRDFRVVHVSSIVPGGDLGIMKIPNSHKVKALLAATLGEQSMIRLYERLLIGRELVVVATRA